MNLFNIILDVTIISIVLVIVNAVKRTKAGIIDERFRRTTPTEGERDTKKPAEDTRGRDIRCSSCGKQAFALVGTDNKYKCETCNHVFDGLNIFPKSNGRRVIV